MGPVHNNTLNKLLSKLLQHLDNLNVSGSFTSHCSTSHGPSGGPVAYHSGPYGYYAPSLAQLIGAPLGFSYQPTQPDSSGHMDTSGQATVLPYAFTTGTLHDPASGAWNFDTGASSHLNNSVNSLSEIFNTCMYPSVLVGDSHSIPVTNMGHSILPTPTRSLHLNNVLITPHIVKNLIYVRQFNICSSICSLINNLIHTLLFQANLPPTFWVEALNMATQLLNILPSTAIANDISCTRLYGKDPNYTLLCIFRCLCYPRL
ncbi:hypothetical protein Tco_1372786 [Tanacetum coccineum]